MVKTRASNCLLLGNPYYYGAVAALKSMLPRGLLYKLYIDIDDQTGVPSLLCTAPCVSAIHDHDSLNCQDKINVL